MSRRLGRGVTYGPVAAWAVLAAGGWGLTQWLDEPVPTSGPGPVAPPASGAEPGPQPEGAYDCAAAGRAAKPVPPPDPSSTGLPGRTVVGEDGTARLRTVICDRAEPG